MGIDGRDISVCLVTYDHANLIESTVRTVLDQTARGFEFVVSDDCSTDGTWEKVLALASADPRITPVRTPGNLGMAGNSNFAAARTSRPWIALLHHDDLYRPDLLEKWGAVAARHPEVGFVFNPYVESASGFVHRLPIGGELLDGRRFLEERIFPRWGCPVRGTALIRRDAWDALGGMREEFGLLADVDLWMRLAARHPVGYVDEPVITVRQERPDYYPEIYSYGSWSWRRMRYLYEIHGRNRAEHYRGLRRAYELAKYRLRVTASTVKWLGYAVVRNRPEMVETAAEGACGYELFPAGWARGVARLLRPAATGGGGRR
jgi:glycosyltransferase involved in cell wall biosynthesis